MPIFETVLTFVEDSGFIGDVLEAAADIGSDVFTTVGDTYFGLEQLNALNPVDPFFSGLDAAAGAYDTVGNFAGSSGFWDTFSPGSILDSATAAIDKFGGAIDQTLTQGFSALGNFDLAIGFRSASQRVRCRGSTIRTTDIICITAERLGCWPGRLCVIG